MSSRGATRRSSKCAGDSSGSNSSGKAGRKVSAFNELIAAARVTADETCFVGDDTPDAEVFPLVGLAAAVGDAHEDAISAAHYVTKAEGGRGAVREVIDLLLAARK